MPVTNTREGDTVIYEFTGRFDVQTAKEYLRLNSQDYNEIGDALGAILDFSTNSQFSISGLRVVQEYTKEMQFDTPVAFIGKADNFLVTFLRGFEALTSRRGQRRFSIFTELSEAVEWIDAWYLTHRKDRDALRGHISVDYPPPST